MLYTENILKITFQNNDKIKAAFYHLESAKYNFKIFESEYTKFNPLIVTPKMNANTDREFASDISAGMQKEFFNGTSISTSVGASNQWGTDADINQVNFIETEVGFPLFSSSRTLERITKRTFEENELYTKNLDYVDAVRNSIKFSLEKYYDLVPRIKIYDMLKNYREELSTILMNETLNLSNSERGQIEAEITNFNSEITGWEIELYSLQLSLQRSMNVSRLNLTQLTKINIDFIEDYYFGKYYIEESIDTIFKQALNNDTEFKVLNIIKKNAMEKKRLAENGRFDIFATLEGRYNFNQIENDARQNDFSWIQAGLKFKINDKKTLKYTITKAQSDIEAIEYTINDRRKLIHFDILKLKDALTKKKEQITSTKSSFKSWEQTYALKKELFLNKKESIDNFIQVHRSLVLTNKTLYILENDYLDRVRDLDYICGEYFKVLNLQD